jgi:hypothetical protein
MIGALYTGRCHNVVTADSAASPASRMPLPTNQPQQACTINERSMPSQTRSYGRYRGLVQLTYHTVVTAKQLLHQQIV